MKRLTLERQLLGWSKQRLAQEARISPSYIGMAEASRRVLYAPELQRIHAVLVDHGYTGDAASLQEEVDVP